MLAVDNDPARADAGDWLGGVLLCAVLALLAWALHHGLVQPWLLPNRPAWPGGAGAGWSARFGAVTQGAMLLAAGWGVAVLVAGLVFGLYLAVMSALFGRLVNNASSALADEDYKGFLRIRIGPDGAAAHMLGCDRVPRRWERAGGVAARPFWRPAPGEPAPRWRVVDRFDMPG
jgi:hypothetical protein